MTVGLWQRLPVYVCVRVCVCVCVLVCACMYVCVSVRQCFPVLQVAHAVMVLVGIGWILLQVKGLPVLYAALQPKSAVADAAAAAGMTVAKTEMQVQ